jgi:hypothetical protein
VSIRASFTNEGRWARKDRAGQLGRDGGWRSRDSYVSRQERESLPVPSAVYVFCRRHLGRTNWTTRPGTYPPLPRQWPLGPGPTPTGCAPPAAPRKEPLPPDHNRLRAASTQTRQPEPLPGHPPWPGAHPTRPRWAQIKPSQWRHFGLTFPRNARLLARLLVSMTCRLDKPCSSPGTRPSRRLAFEVAEMAVDGCPADPSVLAIAVSCLEAYLSR